jgi:D-glutamate cyclase
MPESYRAEPKEVLARNIDRLVTTGAPMGVRLDEWIIVPLYEAASQKYGGKPVSLVAVEELMRKVGKDDRVILVDGFAYPPSMPAGETDGPPGVASLARSLRVGLGALPVIVTGPSDIEAARMATKAAGLNVLDYDQATQYASAVAGAITFPMAGKEESKEAAASILDRCTPKAIISVETIGPNKNGVKHSGAGFSAEAKGTIAHLEELFVEAKARGILTIGMIDRGNEIGSGAILEAVRRITPQADVCRCPCDGGSACVVETDFVFPAAVSNWAAYAFSAVLAYLTKKPSALHGDDMERRILEACAMAGAIDGIRSQTIPECDGIGLKGHQAIVNLLAATVANALEV